MSKYVKKSITDWSLAKLQSHPRQGVFRPHTPAEIQALAELLERDGLICPVEITPDGKIICGHGRVAAAKLLGWETITVWIRRDLTEQGEDAVFRRLVDDNLIKRQLTKIGRGRAFIAMKEQLYEEWQTAGSDQAQGDFRDHLGEILGCDGTTAERWARLAVLPTEYDLLIENGLLTQQQAEQIAKNLPEDIREKLGRKLADIANGDLPRKDKKRHVANAVNARLGKPPKVASRSTWTSRITAALDSAIGASPDSVITFADELERKDGTRLLLGTLRRKYPEQINLLNGVGEEISSLDVDQLRRAVLLMLGLLEKVNAVSDEQ